MRPIYLDYNATTPVAPEVVEAMLPYLREHFGNPSSAHPYGKAAYEAVEGASAGSACHAHDVRLSPVLQAMGVDPDWGMGTLRLSVGRYTTEDEVDTAVGVIVAGLRRLLAAGAPIAERADA